MKIKKEKEISKQEDLNFGFRRYRSGIFFFLQLTFDYPLVCFKIEFFRISFFKNRYLNYTYRVRVRDSSYMLFSQHTVVLTISIILVLNKYTKRTKKNIFLEENNFIRCALRKRKKFDLELFHF